jgi:hypothetical protein
MELGSNSLSILTTFPPVQPTFLTNIPPWGREILTTFSPGRDLTDHRPLTGPQRLGGGAMAYREVAMIEIAEVLRQWLAGPRGEFAAWHRKECSADRIVYSGEGWGNEGAGDRPPPAGFAL